MLKNRNDFYSELTDKLQGILLMYHIAMQKSGSDGDYIVKLCIKELQQLADEMEHYRKTPRVVNG